jgi:germination protein M
MRSLADSATGRALASALSLLLLLVAGCGGDGDSASTTTVRETVTGTDTSSLPTETSKELTIYLLRDGKVAPVSRTVVTGRQVGAAALRELFKGPSADDEGLETAIPTGTKLQSLAIEGGVASVELSKPLPQDDALAQVVYTLTRFPTVRRVDVGADTPVGRRAFEAQTPAILVESPLAGEAVEPGFEVTGTANTFEATFNYELRDDTERVLAEDFVTATSGSGTRGTFAFKVAYTLEEPTDGKLVVFELSAEDGSRINEDEIPLRLE